MAYWLLNHNQKYIEPELFLFNKVIYIKSKYACTHRADLKTLVTLNGDACLSDQLDGDYGVYDI